MELFNINKLINNNLSRFKENIDLIDLSLILPENQSLNEILVNSGYTQRGITATLYQNGNIYLLSERGYLTLAMLMRSKCLL